MPVHSHHTQFAPAPQATDVVGDVWAREIVPRLPVTLDQQAQTLKAFQRIRGLYGRSVACHPGLRPRRRLVSPAGRLGGAHRPGRYLRHRLAQPTPLRQPLAGLADRRIAGRRCRDRARPAC